ncbi:hypothetical protein [Roseivivax sediminis]|uniref:Flp pilus assembly protein, pilin Flp n=1 Tax=Roseivivax sediminis TaxID=936889 RepID=A0A1I1SNF7_9RHOB|nr:hypothetical protein [Roseivivax sediminis]SFD47852.1 hypothetical protein SAMN04515678_101249 [Roseivivax sediminis]
MTRSLQLFLANEDGVVTVEWVVLVAGVATLAILTVLGIRASAVDTADVAIWNGISQLID